MQATAIDLSIIIVNYNTLTLTKQCIDSVFEHTHNIQFEIILVDNASTDGSRNYFINDKRIKYVYNETNLGFGKANNIGFEHSTGNIILCLNSDTVVLNDILEKMVRYIGEAPDNIGLFGTRLIDKDNNTAVSFGTFPVWYNELLMRKTDKPSMTWTNHEQDVDFVSGADLFIRKPLVAQLGLFDTDFFMYYEDVELAYRYRRNGYRAVVVNDSGIMHLEGHSSTNSYRKIRIMTNSYFTYLSKTMSVLKWKLVKSILLSRRMVTVWKYNWTLKEKGAYIFSLFQHK